MGFDWYEDDDATLAGTSYTLTTTAGSASSAIELHCWLNKGSSVGDPETRYLRVYVEDPASPGTYRTSGLDVLDRREIEARIVGSQNPDLVPGFVAAPTAWKPLGTRRTIPVPEIYPNCAIEWEFRINPTTEGGNSSPVTFRVRAVQGVHVDGEILIPEDVTVDGNLDFQGYTLENVVLSQAAAMDANGYGVENLNRSGTKTDAASVEVVFGRSVKRPCRAAATSNVASLSGEQTVDGVALTDGQRVLLTAQSTAAEIGCWYVRTGAWERPLDNDDSYQVYPGILVVVVEGSNKGLWVNTGAWGTEAWALVVALP